MRLLAIDPSINSTGLAYFQDRKLDGSETVNIPKERLDIRLATLANEVKRRCQLFDPNVALIELADRWTRVGKNVEALQMLAMATSAIFTAITFHSQALIYFVPVTDWKGKRKSTEIRREMELLFNVNFPSEHCSDAAGMAHWWMSQKESKGVIF